MKLVYVNIFLKNKSEFLLPKMLKPVRLWRMTKPV